MLNDPRTRDSLLIRVANPDDDDAWRQFAAIYQPVVYRISRQRGLQDADAHDVVQHVMTAVSQAIHRWENDADRASFRTWLYRIANNAFVDFVRKRRPDAARGGTSVLKLLSEQADAESNPRSDWEFEHRRETFRWAARLIRNEFSDSTWAAFMRTTVDDLTPAEAAKELGMTLGSVYTARSRVMRRLKSEVEKHG